MVCFLHPLCCSLIWGPKKRCNSKAGRQKWILIIRWKGNQKREKGYQKVTENEKKVTKKWPKMRVTVRGAQPSAMLPGKFGNCLSEAFWEASAGFSPRVLRGSAGFPHFGPRAIFYFLANFFPTFGFRPIFHSIPGGLTRKPCVRKSQS